MGESSGKRGPWTNIVSYCLLGKEWNFTLINTGHFKQQTVLFCLLFWLGQSCFRSWSFNIFPLFFDRRFLFNWSHALNAVAIKALSGKLLSCTLCTDKGPKCLLHTLYYKCLEILLRTYCQPFATSFEKIVFVWHHTVAAILTGLKLIDSTLDQWLMKVMSGFVGWEALFYILLDVHLKWKVNSTGKYILSCFFIIIIIIIVIIVKWLLMGDNWQLMKLQLKWNCEPHLRVLISLFRFFIWGKKTKLVCHYIVSCGTTTATNDDDEWQWNK